MVTGVRIPGGRRARLEHCQCVGTLLAACATGAVGIFTGVIITERVVLVDVQTGVLDRGRVRVVEHYLLTESLPVLVAGALCGVALLGLPRRGLHRVVKLVAVLSRCSCTWRCRIPAWLQRSFRFTGAFLLGVCIANT